jgi:SAM-dependent methyltransferase
MLDVVIFSKDRACQLDLLLRSIKREFSGWRQANVQVLYTYSNRWFGAAYDGVLAAHPEFSYTCELSRDQGFRELTLELVGKNPFVTFLVDDDVFKQPFTLDTPEFARFANDSSIMCLSLRMCPRMDYCYTRDFHTPIPVFEAGNVWEWRGLKGDWGYPMSIDGHIFRSAELVPQLHHLDFKDPNTFEDALARHPLPNPKAICFDESRVINLPVNRVQDTAPNRHGAITAESLNARYLSGSRLSLDTVAGVANPSPHHELPLLWDERGANPPLVSVVIPCFNAEQYLAATIDSVATQTLRDLEVLVVDDGSTDASVEVARRWTSDHPDLDVHILRRPASGHPAHTRNSGVAHARGRYILCLDADDQLTPDLIERSVIALTTHPEAGIAYADQQDFGSSDAHHTVPPYDFARLTCQNFLGIASLFRRQAWVDAGGFDGSGRYEDWDFWIGCGEHGHHGIRVDGTYWRYRVRSDGRFLTGGVKRDRVTKAQIVLRRPGLYTESQRRWAQGVLAGDPIAEAVADQLYVVPDVSPADLVPTPPPPAPATAAMPASPPPAPQTDDQRQPGGSAVLPGPAGTFLTVILAEEAIRHPELVAGYRDRFGADDDAKLILFAPDADPAELAPRLLPLAATAGLDAPLAPAVTALAVPAAEGEAVLLGQAHALLTVGGPTGALGRLPTFGVDRIGALRAHAARVWTQDTAPQLIFPVPGGFEVPQELGHAYPDGQHHARNVAGHFSATLQHDAAVVYDIDAGCGYFSALAGNRGAAVYSFEPAPALFDVLRRNRARTGLSHDGAFCLPIGATVTLDNSVERFELAPPTVIKLNAAGEALAVLRGARRLLVRHHPRILVPFDEMACGAAGYRREALVDELLAFGYDVWGLSEDVEDPTPYPVELFSLLPITNLVATYGTPPPLPGPVTVETAPRAPVNGHTNGHNGNGHNGNGHNGNGHVALLPAPATIPVPAIVAHRPGGWDWFSRDLATYRAMPGGADVNDADLMPKLTDKTPGNPYDGHYFFQDVWAARRVAELQPAEHVDVGSRIDYVGFLTALTNVVFVDIRLLEAQIEGLRSVTGSILAMPFPDQSLESVSCLHVAEHIGLGRYGDPLNPHGTLEAARELQRVIRPGGQLLFAVPVGRARTCFNAHRIFDPREVPEMFPELELVEFAGVDDSITFRRHRPPAELAGSNYACGMYRFRRPLC